MSKKLSYAEIKDLARENGTKVTDLLALAPQNDPYYTGAPATVEAAEWFRELWVRFGYSEGVHLRRMHYQLVSQVEATKPDGSVYSNTEGDWGYLCNAGKYARYLGMVPAEAFVDRRNPDPHLFVVGQPDWDHDPEASIQEPTFETPVIKSDLGELDWRLPTPWVQGYGYDNRDQGFHLELWIEKSTMDDVLLPLGERLGVNVATSLGFQSITSVIALLKRIAARGKPARIFYVSDFDPAGDGMPVAVARQVQFWLDEIAPDADIALVPIALTREQVMRYDLPTIPVKDTDLRKANFSARYAINGAVELDALEALHPGTLARIVEDAVKPYRDEDLSRRLRYAGHEASRQAESEWQDETDNERRELADLQTQATEIVAVYDETLSRLARQMAADLAPITAALDELRQAISAKIQEFHPELPKRPQPEPRGDVLDEAAWLYCSDRDYLAQNDAYRSRKAGTQNG